MALNGNMNDRERVGGELLEARSSHAVLEPSLGDSMGRRYRISARSHSLEGRIDAGRCALSLKATLSQ